MDMSETKSLIIMIVVIVLGLVGYVKNIIALSNCDFDAPYKCEVVHGLGILPPVGVITGWIDCGR